MITAPFKSTRHPRRRPLLRAAVAGLALLGVGMSAHAGIDVRAPFTHVGVGHGGVGVSAPFTNVQVGHHRDNRRDRSSHHGKRDVRLHESHRYSRNDRSHAYRDRHDNGRYDARHHRDGRYDRRYADQYHHRHHEKSRGGFFGRW